MKLKSTHFRQLADKLDDAERLTRAAHSFLGYYPLEDLPMHLEDKRREILYVFGNLVETTENVIAALEKVEELKLVVIPLRSDVRHAKATLESMR